MKSAGRQIVMLLSNSFEPDVRVLKEARSLVQGGLLVTILCWDREKRFPPVESFEGIIVRRIRLQGRYGRGVLSMLDFFYFYAWVVWHLCGGAINAIHCHDLDTLPVGFFIARFAGAKVIYDAHETEYFGAFPAFAQRFLARVEQFLAKRSDRVFVTNQIQLKKFCQVRSDEESIVELKNAPSLEFFPKSLPQSSGDKLRLGWIGYLQARAGIEQTIGIFDELCARHDHLELVFVGKIHENFRAKFERELAQSRYREKIKVVGALPYAEVKRYYERIDLSLLLYDNIPQFRFNTPTKLYEAMAHGIPVIATGIGDVEEIISGSGCGFVVDAKDRQTTIDLLEKLIVDPQLRWEMGRRGHQAALKHYNWEIMEKRLLAAYKDILPT